MIKNMPYLKTSTYLLLIFFFTCVSFYTHAQTTVFTDDFSTNTNATYTTTGAIGASGWSVTRSGADWGARRNTSPQQLELTNDVGATGNLNGWVFTSTTTSSFSSPYNTTLSSNTGLITWTFNMRTNRTTALSGFGSTNTYGMAFILASTSNASNTTGSGYAVVMGGGTNNSVSLISFNNGLRGTRTTIVAFGGAPSALTNYMSVKVTYDPVSNSWQLFNRDDGSTGFADPLIGTLTSLGTGTNSTYTGVVMSYLGAYWQGSTFATQTAFFDNVTVSVTNPNIAISSSSPSAGYVYPNTTDNILYSIKLDVTTAGVTFTGLTIGTGGTYVIADLTATPFKLYINSTNSISGATQLGSAQAAVTSGGIISFTGLSQTISSGSTRYLLVTADIAATAAVNDNINITSTAFSNISFSGTPNKTGTDPVPAGNLQTIYYGTFLSNSGSPSAGNIARSSTDNTIFGFTITPVNTSSLFTFSSVTITATGTATSSDLSNFRIVKDVDSSGDYTGSDIVVSNTLSFGTSMTFTISNDTNNTTTSHYILITDVAAGATLGNTITASINANADVTLNADITSTAPYGGYQQTIIDPTNTSTAADYFKSVDPNGNWSTTSTWQSSLDGVTLWHTATLVPTSSAKLITISNGTVVTINNNETAKKLTIETTGTLKHNNGYTFQIVSGGSFTINGIYVLNGTSPTLSGTATAQVNSGGLVRADNNTGGGSDNFASSTKVLFKTGSVFQWNTAASAFSTSGITYFQGTGYANEKPIFRISANPGFLGGNNDLTINGKLEATTGAGSNIRFRNSGKKIFRDGIGGSGQITHQSSSGAFQITGSSAVIDATMINIDHTTGSTADLEITDAASVSISGSPAININSGAYFVVNGTLTQTATTPVYLDDANLVINGYIDDQSANGAFQADNSTTNSTTVTIGNNTSSPNNSASVGTITFSPGFNYVSTWTMNRALSNSNPSAILGSDVIVNNLTLTKGILATGNHLLTYNKTGTLTLPSSYSNSYVCTCDATGTEISATGNNGFRIDNVSGGTDQMFPVGTDFVSANRMAINMNSFNTNTFTVVVGKGDIGGTPLPRVNRIWYVSSTDTAQATMKLYFTKWPWYVDQFGVAQDEVEDGFNYDDPRLVQKDYTDLFVNTTTMGTSDVKSYSGTLDYTEIYGLYSYNISSDYRGLTKGVNSFTRFSVINLSDVVLPVTIINFRAYQKNNGVQIEWSALNEMNVDHYEVEKSINGINFTSLGVVKARNNSNAANYSQSDPSPVRGKNLYRVKAIDKNGKITYTAIATVNINGDKTSISIYPNPIRNKFINIRFSNIPHGKYQLLVYNSLGVQVFRATIEHAGGSSTQNFSLPFNIKTGVYVLKIINETFDFTNRIIVE